MWKVCEHLPTGCRMPDRAVAYYSHELLAAAHCGWLNFCAMVTFRDAFYEVWRA